MGQKIKDAAVYVVDPNKKYEVNVPDLLAELQMSPNMSTRHLKAIDILSQLLLAITIQAVKINDPKIVEVLKRMKLVFEVPDEIINDCSEIHKMHKDKDEACPVCGLPLNADF